MDWTDYPKPPVGLDDTVDTSTSLAAFLGLDPAEGAAIIDLIALAALTSAEAVDGLAVPYPREVTAWRAWATNQHTGTAADLLATLDTIPDPQLPGPTDPQLVPVQLDRIQVADLGGTSYVTVRYRTDPQEPMRMVQFTTEAASVEFDPTLLVDPAGACVSIRLTVPEEGTV